MGIDLFAGGMSSPASVSVLFALKDRFDVEFPAAMLKRSGLESVAGIESGLAELWAEAP